MLSTIKEVGNFGVLFMLFIYIYALIGMQVFSNQFRFDELGYPVDRYHAAAYIPRANFDTLIWSMVTVFQVSLTELLCRRGFVLIFDGLWTPDINGRKLE